MNNTAAYCVNVQVQSEFLPEQSDESAHRYVFAYHITMHNAGTVAAQLLTRHWVVTDGNQKIQEVHGEGVIGEKPRLAPGESYRYSSGTVLTTPVGAMHGSYQMMAADGTRFEAPIAPFTLAVPRRLH
ncbi:MAG: Co2+/Mg2+ efflux protein ApaG [Pseudomonadota bacterium]